MTSALPMSKQRLAEVNVGDTLDITSIDVTQIAAVNRIEKRDGSGTLHLHMGFYRDSDGDKVEKEFTLQGVPQVRELGRLIVAMIREKTAT